MLRQYFAIVWHAEWPSRFSHVGIACILFRKCIVRCSWRWYISNRSVLHHIAESSDKRCCQIDCYTLSDCKLAFSAECTKVPVECAMGSKHFIHLDNTTLFLSYSLFILICSSAMGNRTLLITYWVDFKTAQTRSVIYVVIYISSGTQYNSSSPWSLS